MMKITKQPVLVRSLTVALALLFCLPGAALAAEPAKVAADAVAVASLNSTEQHSLPAAESGTPELLTDQEAADLSARAEEPGSAVVGGALTNQQLTYIVIALATAVIVLVAQ